MTRRLLLARHGQSTTNAADVFTGWSDPPLTDLGVAEAHGMAATLADADAIPDVIFTSSLQRTIHTAAIVRDDLGLSIDLQSSHALDERDYGDLTGMNKAEIAERYGADQTRIWRRSWSATPPNGESLRDTAARVLPYYLRGILPTVLRDRTVLVVAHGNSLRALMIALEGVSPNAAETVEIGTGAIRSYVIDPSSMVARASWLARHRGVH
jgi:2,3-bisphosphoglycerate-dependent phosphoglycerate mutase